MQNNRDRNGIISPGDLYSISETTVEVKPEPNQHIDDHLASRSVKSKE